MHSNQTNNISEYHGETDTNIWDISIFILEKNSTLTFSHFIDRKQL